MARRRSSSNVFGMFAKNISEAAAGRIHWFSNMWTVIGSRWDKNRVQNPRIAGKRPDINERGEWEKNGATITRKQCVTTCPSPPGEDFFINEKGQAWVPASECRKCEHHRKADKRYRFPRCVFGKEDTPKAICERINQTLTEVMDTAYERARDITG